MPKPGFFRMLACVGVALLAAGCTKWSSSSSAVNTDGQTPAAAPGAVTGLRVTQPHPWNATPTTWKVTVAWHAPASGTAVDHYEVARDGRTVDRDVTTTSFQDADIEPSAAYHYQVMAVSADGTAGEPAKASAKTGEPSLQDARLDGKYVTRFTPTSSSLGINRTIPALVIFTANCGTGACDSQYRRVGLSGSGTLHRTGASYAGSVSAPFAILSCQGGRINESLSFAIHVTKGDVVRGQWTATAYEGSLTETASSSGCVTATNHWTITGKTSP
ncbi:MAG: fibronectin type III domain-containing protein [Actinomycetota bacterium]